VASSAPFPPWVHESLELLVRWVLSCGINEPGESIVAKIANLVAVLAAWGAVSAAWADPIPAGWKARNIQPVGYLDTGGRFVFKESIKQYQGRWYLFTVYRVKEGTDIPASLLVIDVTDPSTPKIVKKIDAPANTDMPQLSLNGNLLMTSLSRPNSIARMSAAAESFPDFQRPQPEGRVLPSGVAFWDISNPVNPVQVGVWQAGSSYGTHRNSYPGGKYAYLSAGKPSFRSNILLILDVSDPKNPKEIATWHQQGQKEGEALENPDILPGFHGPASVSPDGKMLTMGYTPNVVNLDITDIEHPKLIGKLQLNPPFAYNQIQSIHTVLPYWDRKLLYVNDEAKLANCGEPLPLHGLIDNSNPTKPTLMSLFPVPRPPAGSKYKDFCELPGRFGPHNVSTEIHNPDVARPGNLIHVAYFNAGLQVFDITNPRLPTNPGYFLPADSKEPTVSQSGYLNNYIAQDIVVDTRGYIYMTGSGGLYILKDAPGKVK
jgi:hypothetical protein